MALITKLTNKGFDSTGRVLTINDSTGAYSTSNEGGWGAPNPTTTDVQKILFTVSKYDDPEVYQALWVRTPDPANQYEFSEPSIDEFLTGTDIQLNSLVLGTSTVEQGLIPFHDGVYDINAYYTVATESGYTGTKGNIYIEGIDTNTIVETYDSVLIQGKVYQIDKSKPTNGGSIFYLDRELEDDTTSIEPAYRAQSYALNLSYSTCATQTLVGKATQACGCGKKYKEVYLDMLVDTTAANIAFCRKDYSKANLLATSSEYRGKQCNCGC